jgi:hypothetical protein
MKLALIGGVVLALAAIWFFFRVILMTTGAA